MTDFERPNPGPTAGPSTAHDDTAATPVATAPIGSRGGGRARWAAAAGLLALVIGVTGIAALSLTGASPAADVLGYVPDDSVMYGEVRLDLPGDQRQEVGEFLAKFPGFADQAALDTKLDEVLDRLLSDATEGEQTFSRDVKPWFDGELAFSMGPLPADAGEASTLAAPGRMLALIAIKDEALARAWFDDVLADATTTSTETYAGSEIRVYDGPNGGAAFAVVGGKVAVAGDLTSVKASIDTQGASGLAADEAFKAALAATDGDHIGFFFMDTRAIVDAAMALAEDAGHGAPMNDALLALVPDWTAGRLRVEGDALVMDSLAPHVDATPGPDSNRANGVAAYAPASTILLAAGNDAGASALEAIALYRQDPTLAEMFTEVDQAAGVLGGLDAALGWMGDTGVVVARAGDGVEGGLVSVPADAEAAERLLTTVRSFIGLAGGQMGFELREEPYAGTTITIVDLGSAADLAGMAGGMGGVPIPTEPGMLPEGNVELAYAATDGVVVIGSSPDFVKHVLDAGAGSSLADDARYQGLVGRVGAEHTGITFVDVAAIRGLVEGLLTDASPEERAEYEESIKPFLTPFDALVAAGQTGEDLERQHLIVTVD
jgi:hypothetical protein